MVTIRPERPEDISDIREVNEKAFGQMAEAGIVDTLRFACPDVLSLAALSEESVFGHILFSPVQVEDGSRTIQGMVFLPMAMLPELQRQGIESRLVKAGKRILLEQNCRFDILLGRPGFYPRRQWEGLRDAVFRVIVFDEAAMAGVTGIARSRDKFGAMI